VNNPEVTRETSLSVLIVSAYADPHVGGVEVVVGQQARTLAACGHDVTVVTSRCGGAGAMQEQVDGYTVVRVAAWNGLEERSGVPFPVWSPSAMWRLARLIANADIVHVHDVYHGSSVLAAILAKRRGRPLFITQHVGLVEHDKAVVKYLQRLMYTSVGRLLWRWATAITIYNPIVGAFLSEHGVQAGKVKLTYNGIDTRDFAPGDPRALCATRRRHGLATDVPVILFVGRLVPKKGFQKLVEARGPEYQVVLVGPGRMPKHAPTGVKLLGPVNRAELRDLYQASDIFAFPAVGEMLTLAMQEAMACGLPVVATAEDAYSGYDLDPTGVALVSPEADVLRATFLEILNDPDRMRHMQNYSRRLAEERFDWLRNSEHVASEYRSACDFARSRGRRPPAPMLDPTSQPAASPVLTTSRER
jgi:D-inositol-3-phosphate glycosyltransferase